VPDETTHIFLGNIAHIQNLTHVPSFPEERWYQDTYIHALYPSWYQWSAVGLKLGWQMRQKFSKNTFERDVTAKKTFKSEKLLEYAVSGQQRHLTGRSSNPNYIKRQKNTAII
jgi:hypothetical protein